MANLQQLTQRSEVGAIKPWAKTTAPDGYVLCDGASLTRTGTYADLFAVIGTTYGTADGTHFNVPNLQGKTPQGYDGNTYNLAGTGGANTVTVAVTNNQAVSSVTNTVTNNQAVAVTNNQAVAVTNNQAVTVTGSISNTSLTEAQTASHSHTFTGAPYGNTYAVLSASSGGPPVGTADYGSPSPRRNQFTPGISSVGSGTGHTHAHTLAGTMTGAVTSALTGTVTSALTGTVAVSSSGGALSGTVTAAGTNSFSPYVVVNYIIRY